jgi:integrase
MKSARYLEIGNTASGQSFLFVKRISIKKGKFPTHHENFPERFKRKIGNSPAMRSHEATNLAMQLSNDIEHLQMVSMRDKTGRANTTKDMVKAGKTWLWFNEIEDLSEILSKSSNRTKDGQEASNTISILTDVVKDFYGIEGDGFVHKTIFTPFGDHLLGVLKSGQAGNLFSEAVHLWAQHTNRGHLNETDKAIHDAKRFVKTFNDFTGDRPIDQITRPNVAAYILDRLKSVKTTSVDREIHTLRAVWNRAADALDIGSRNPFERQVILGLGTDAVRRPTPTLENHQKLMQLLKEHPRKQESYAVSMVAVIALTGLRLSEAWGLLINDFDRIKHQLNVQPNELRGLKSAHSERPFPVAPELGYWLDLYLNIKRPSSSNTASATVAKFLKNNGFNLTAHCLRHGFKQRLVEVGTPSSLIEELMGWSDQSMMRHYGVNAITLQKIQSVQLAYEQIMGFETARPTDQNVFSTGHAKHESAFIEIPLKRIKTSQKIPIIA